MERPFLNPEQSELQFELLVVILSLHKKVPSIFITWIDIRNDSQFWMCYSLAQPSQGRAAKGGICWWRSECKGACWDQVWFWGLESMAVSGKNAGVKTSSPSLFHPFIFSLKPRCCPPPTKLLLRIKIFGGLNNIIWYLNKDFEQKREFSMLQCCSPIFPWTAQRTQPHATPCQTLRGMG